MKLLPWLIMVCVFLGDGLVFAKDVATKSLPNFTFDRHLIHIMYSPYVAPDDKPYQYRWPEMQGMLHTISTRFSKLWPPNIQSQHVNTSSIAEIPRAVAHFNRANSNGTWNSKLELTLEFSYSPVAELRINYTSPFDVNLKLSEEANDIWPGTVTSLFMQGKLDDMKDVLVELAVASEKIRRARHWFRLGAVFSIERCDEVEIVPYKEMINKIEFVLFDKWPEQAHYDMGVAKALPDFTGQFEKCRHLMQTLYPKVQVGFRTSWPDSSKNGTQNMPELVRFWAAISKWAVSHNTTIIFQEAFDQPSKGLDYGSTNGWWRFKPYQEKSKDPNLYEFEEKMMLVPSFTSALTPYEGTQSASSSNLAIWIAGSVVALIVMGLVVGLIVSVCKYKQKFQDAQEQVLLSKLELDEFFDGKVGDSGDFGDCHGINEMTGLAYNRDLEISKDNFVIDLNSPLGSGEFGIVCRGKLEDEFVAVKTLNPKSSTLATFKGLLSEIKVLSYLGQHENLVRLLGANTARLEKGTVFLFMELCSQGSLLKYLRRLHASSNPKRETNGNGGYTSIEALLESSRPDNEDFGEEFGEELEVDLNDLRKWAVDIAHGMQYLAEKRVVHADLAARNVLLTNSKTAKICDFGLSQRLYDYTNYVKSRQEPLPWRWMSPESLKRLEFNEKTDVWAYGVTVWEIYSLGTS